jgi:flavin reductase (DIM6/NTAB) family NADH-FMN oxidoreductase RutF
MHFSSKDIDSLDQQKRVHLINSLSGFKSANLVGTKDKQGQENLAIVSSVFHVGANPPLIGMIIRPHSVPRHTLENMIETGCFTLNQIHQNMIIQAHQTSARYPKDVSEFAAVGLTSEYKGSFAAPFVAQSKIKVALELKSTQTIELNQTELVIGQITDIYLEDDQALNPDGFIDHESLGSVAISGLDSYHKTLCISRLSYAKPNVQPTPITFNK